MRPVRQVRDGVSSLPRASRAAPPSQKRRRKNARASRHVLVNVDVETGTEEGVAAEIICCHLPPERKFPKKVARLHHRRLMT